MVIDDLDRHLPAAGSIERAVVPMAMYLAWCVNLQLLDSDFQSDHEGQLLRLRYREISPAEFLTTTCGGHFSSALLNPEGQRFTDGYYQDYLRDFAATFGTTLEGVYAVNDDWATYDQIARVLTRRIMASKSASRSGNYAEKGRRKWWQVWR
ncbi:MAG: hypothetical protein ACC642_10540 [Pseudomonadales bacterium]